MFPLPLRLHPADDLREALRAALTSHGHAAAFVLSGIGSLAPARGCRVRTTAEVLLAVLPGHRFERRIDAVTGYAELDILKDAPSP